MANHHDGARARDLPPATAPGFSRSAHWTLADPDVRRRLARTLRDLARAGDDRGGLTNDRRIHAVAEISPSEVAFVGLNGTRPIMWWLVASAVVMLISIVVSFVTGEFLDLAALLSGGQERGGIAVFIFIAVMTLIACGMSLMKGNGRRLILTPGGLTLKMSRTGSAAAWSAVIEVVETRRSVSIVSSGGRFSFRPRDLDSDSTVLADVIRYYLSNPAQRQSIGAGTAQLLRSGELEAWAAKRAPH